MKRRHAQRAADVGAERQRAVTRRERRRRSAGGAAGRAAEIERIVGGAVDLVVALPVAERDGTLVLPRITPPASLTREIDSASSGGDEILLRRKTPGRRQSRDVEGFLDRHGNAEQRPGLAARAGRVGGAGGIEAAGEIANADRIDLGVVTLDAADRVLRQLHRGDFLCRQRRRQFGRGLEAPLRFGQDVLPLVRSFEPDDAQFRRRPQAGDIN